MILTKEQDTSRDRVAHRLALSKGYLLQEYRIERVLGKGGFGMTYLARNEMLDMPVAIKEMLPDGIATRVEGSQVVAQTRSMEESFAWARQRFMEEARMLARLDHPNIVRVQRMIEANGTAYMVMEYVDGMSLADRLRRKAGISESELLSIVHPLLSGLEHVHSRGLLHRDIKPENIFISTEGRVLLLDFGSARADLGRTSTMTTVVSEGYSPLEQYQTRTTQGPYTDIYALAAVMARIITGTKPPSPVDRLADESLFPPLAGRTFPGWSPAALRAVDAGLQVLSRDRVPSVAAFRGLLVQQQSTLRLTPGPTHGGTPQPSKRGRLAAMVLGIVAIAALAWYAVDKFFPGDQKPVEGAATTTVTENTTPAPTPTPVEPSPPIAPAPAPAPAPVSPTPPSVPAPAPSLVVNPTPSPAPAAPAPTLPGTPAIPPTRTPAPVPAPSAVNPAPTVPPSTPPRAPEILPKSMSGMFVYGRSYGLRSGNQVKFTLSITSTQGSRFTGVTEEPYSGFGKAVNGHLYADVVGTCTLEQGITRVTFTKTYRHFPQEPVDYTGSLSRPAGVLSGTWTFPGRSSGGTFILTANP